LPADMATHRMTDKTVEIAIFAKAPIEGLAKTRLIPCLGARGAAHLQEVLIERAVRTALASEAGPVSLWCTPDCEHPFFMALEKTYPITLNRQSDGDLGERMLGAFRQLTSRAPALLLGTDCVAMDAKHIRDAARLLQTGQDAVLLPVEDGGYIMIGMTRPHPELFDAMPWGSSRVMKETARRAKRLGLKFALFELLWDIDRPEDYGRAVSAGAL